MFHFVYQPIPNFVSCLLLDWQHHLFHITQLLVAAGEPERSSIINLTVQPQLTVKFLNWNQPQLMANSTAVTQCGLFRKPNQLFTASVTTWHASWNLYALYERFVMHLCFHPSQISKQTVLEALPTLTHLRLTGRANKAHQSRNKGLTHSYVRLHSSKSACQWLDMDRTIKSTCVPGVFRMIRASHWLALASENILLGDRIRACHQLYATSTDDGMWLGWMGFCMVLLNLVLGVVLG